MSISNTPLVFISYARDDGEDIARQLRERLAEEEAGISVWQDRSQMEGGVSWWKQITEALEVVRFLVLVMTPGAMQSTMVQKEWRYARQRGVSVYPVFGQAGDQVSLNILPRWMRKAHFFDLEREWETFVNYLKSPRRENRVPFMAPDLPSSFVARPDLYRPVVDALTGEDKASVALTTSLQGAGGLGKTTLAAAICHDEDIIEEFSDGILWVTLGNDPKILDECAKLYVALTGERVNFIDEGDAEFHLSQVLQEKKCLLVIDDAWRPADMKPFMRGGANSARLITTRIAGLAAEAQPFAVNEMRRSEAVELLANGLPIDPDLKGRYRTLSHKLGEWPLLLELANAQLRRRLAKSDTITGALDYVERKLSKQGIVAFDVRQAQHREEAISVTMDLSLEFLSGRERGAFLGLALFAEDTEIPLEIAADLWFVDEFEAEEWAMVFDEMSLARFRLQDATIRLHDVVRSYAETCLPDLPSQHDSLVASLKPALERGDPFAWRWQSYHLVQAGRGDALRDALLDIDWLLAKLKATDLENLIEDFRYLPDDPDTGLILEAIQLSSYALSGNPDELPGQLFARLAFEEQSAALREFCERLTAWRGKTWFQPVTPALTAAGNVLIGTLRQGNGAILALRPLNSDYLATGAIDGTLTIWDWRRAKQVEARKIHPDAIRSLDVSTSGEIIATGSFDGTIKLLNADAPADQVSEFRIDHIEAAPIFVLLKNGTHLAGAIGDRVFVHALSAQDQPMDLLSLGGQANAIAASNGDGFYIACESGEILAWSSADPLDARHIGSHDGPVAGLAVAADAGDLFSVGADATLRKWTEVEPETWHADGLSDRIFHASTLAVTKDGKTAAAGSLDGQISLWDVETRSMLKVLEGHAGAINDLRFGPDDNLLLSGSDDGTIRVWDPSRPPARRRTPDHVGPVRAVAIASDDRVGFSTSDGRNLEAWDLTTGKPLTTWVGDSAWLVTIDDIGSYAVVLLPGDRLHAWSLQDDRIKTVTHAGGLRALQVAVTEERALSIDVMGFLSLWDLQKRTCEISIPVRTDFVKTLLVSRSFDHVLALRPSNAIDIQSTRTGELRTEAAEQTNLIALSHQNSVAAAVTSGGRALLFGSHQRDLSDTVDLSGANALVLSGDGSSVLVASEAGTIDLRDVGSGKREAQFTLEAPISACAMSDDGGLILTGDRSGFVNVMRLLKPQPVSDAQGISNNGVEDPHG
ncbi:MAG: TIR domain-containing protein [Pseudomonadota bacterium]